MTKIDTTKHAYDLDAVPTPTAAPVRSDEGQILNLGDAYLWSGKGPVPVVGAPVTINFNGLGSGTVAAYFHEHGWLGVKVRLDNPPAWHAKQNAGTKHAGFALVFGAELTWA